jgi:tetratricopeptide (TPR) repeat protein
MKGLFALTAGLALVSSSCAPLPPPDQKLRGEVKSVKDDQKPEVLLERGRAFYAVGDLTRAEQYLAAALQSGADERKVMPLLMKVCIEDRKYRVALDYGENTLKRHPSDHRLRFLVASLYVATGENPKAKQHLEQLLSANPQEAEAHYVYAVLLKDSEENLLEADRHFREYLRLQPHGAHAEEARGSLLKSVP